MDTTIINVECVLITGLVVGGLLCALLRRLQRTRPDLGVGTPLAVGYGLRVIILPLLTLAGIGATLRGPDEHTWMAAAHQLARLGWSSSSWLPFHTASYLHVQIFAAQLKLLGSPEGALRITQIGISLTAILLVVASVYDLSSPRAARLSAWILALEPASMFFSGSLLKDPLSELATALVAFGGAKIWNKIELKGVALMALGGALGIATRQYLGWFLMACAFLVLVHAALRQLGSHLRSLPVLYAAVAVVFVATPTVLAMTSHRSLEENLQPIQSAESTTGVGSTQISGNHLALAPVNFSSRGAVLSNLPQRMSDVILRPFPWQVRNLSEMLGAVGSLVALAGFFLLVRFAWLSRGSIFRRAGPLVYPFLFSLTAFSLATGNAGQGFRYRTDFLPFVFGGFVVLRECLRQSEEYSERPLAEGDRAPAGEKRLSNALAPRAV